MLLLEQDVIDESSKRPATDFRITLRIAPNNEMVTDYVGVLGHSRLVTTLWNLCIVVFTEGRSLVGHTNLEGGKFVHFVARELDLLGVDLVVFHFGFLVTHFVEGCLLVGKKDSVDITFIPILPSISELYRYGFGFLCNDFNGLSKAFDYGATVGVNNFDVLGT